MRNNRLVPVIITIGLATLLVLQCGNACAEVNTKGEDSAEPQTTTPNEKLPPVSQVLSTSDAFSITKELTDFDVVVYNVIISKATLSKVLTNLAEVSGMKLTLDDHIDTTILYSFISIYLEKVPLDDILEIILGIKGLEYVIKDENEIWVTFPTKLSFDSPLDYLKEKAVQLYQKAQIKYPNSPLIIKAYYDLGNYYYNIGSHLMAVQEFQTIVDSYPTDDLARHSMINIGKSYEKLSDYENARHYYFRFIDTYCNDELLPSVYLSIGDTWYIQGEYSKAISIYKKIIESFSTGSPENAKLAQLQMGRSYQRMGKYEEAMDAFVAVKKQLTSEKEEYKAEVKYHIGNCLFQMGKYDEASAVLGNLLVSELTHPMADDAYCKFADCSHMSGDYFGAIQGYRGFLASFPDSKLAPHAQYYLGMSHKYLKLYGTAINVFLQGLKKYPSSPYRIAMEFALAQCYFEKEDFHRACETFRRYIENISDPRRHVEADFYIAECLFHERKYDEALTAYKTLFDLDPALVQPIIESVYKRIGDCYKELGQIEKSILAYQGKSLEDQ